MTRGTAWPARKSVTRKQEASAWGERADGQRLSGWDDKKVLKLDSSDNYPTTQIHLMPLNLTLKND